MVLVIKVFCICAIVNNDIQDIFNVMNNDFVL